MSENTPEQTADVEPEADVEPADSPATEAGDDPAPEGADALGDAGKKALDAMKSKWRQERDERRKLQQILEERNTPEKGDTNQPDADAIRREAMQAANARILRSEIKAAAAGKLADPADAYRFLDLDRFEVSPDGEIDTDEIAEALEELVQNKPYLAAQSGKRFQGSGDGGAARKASGPSQLTRADLERMSPAQIVKAKAEGRLSDLMAGKA